MNNVKEALLWSLNVDNGQVTTKVTYDVVDVSKRDDGVKWWHTWLWKWNFPLRIKSLSWFLMDKKIATC